MRRLAALALVPFLAALSACSANVVGNACYVGGEAAAGQDVIASAALECQSRLCVHLAGAPADLCTGRCESDDDCDAAASSPCASGFTCAVATPVGPFACEKLCLCRDDVAGRGATTPATCADRREE